MAAADYRLMTEATGQRIAVALENLAGFGAYLTTADVVNNLTSTDPTKALAAPQGKVLNDKIATLVKTKSINGTTDSTGDISLGLSTSQCVPISFRITGGEIRKASPVLFLQNALGDTWWAKFINDNDLQNQSNITIEGTLYYLMT